MKGQKVIDFLRNNNIHFDIIKHPTAFTAQGIAHAAHISGKMLAKTVIVNVDGKFKMLVMPANKRINIDALKGLLWAKNVRLATEDEFREIFTDCEIGGMPPFGNLYGLDTYIASELTRDEEIAFNAGSHSQLCKITYSDYAKLAHPKVMEFS